MFKSYHICVKCERFANELNYGICCLCEVKK